MVHLYCRRSARPVFKSAFASMNCDNEKSSKGVVEAMEAKMQGAAATGTNAASSGKHTAGDKGKPRTQTSVFADYPGESRGQQRWHRAGFRTGCVFCSMGRGLLVCLRRQQEGLVLCTKPSRSRLIMCAHEVPGRAFCVWPPASVPVDLVVLQMRS